MLAYTKLRTYHITTYCIDCIVDKGMITESNTKPLKSGYLVNHKIFISPNVSGGTPNGK